MSRVVIVVIVLVVLAIALSHVPSAPNFAFASWPHDGVTEKSQGSYRFAPQGTLQISDASGDVTIHGSDSNVSTIDITVTKHADNRSQLEQLVPQIGAYNGGVAIESQYPSMCMNCDISYTIDVPRSAQVAVSDDSGDVKITGTNGIITVKASSGGVTLEDDSGPTSVDLDSGDASLTDVTGTVRVANSSGDIDASGLENSVDFVSSSGDIKANYARFDGVSTVHMQAHSGSIELKLPSGAGAKISASTSNGSLDSDILPVHENDSGADASGTIGDGHATVNVTTDSGDISINGHSS
ncbi:MAG TPA: DUF4097 family beta strand repeat-containing protein [Candidatus Eremiobacteraceae bacterium]|nr:DUF4097 family beta strand repeat-containing protein [Candidatus Eremiobacteraceae bacterium]